MIIDWHARRAFSSDLRDTPASSQGCASRLSEVSDLQRSTNIGMALASFEAGPGLESQ